MEHTIEGRTYILVQQTEEDLDEGYCGGCVADYDEVGDLCANLIGCSGKPRHIWKEKPQQ